MSVSVFVLDRKHRPLMPYRPARTRSYLTRQKRVHGFATGDMVRAEVPSGKKAGTYQVRVTVRNSGSFNIQTSEGIIQGIGWRHCQQLSYNDGYGYAWLRPAPHSSPV